MKQYVIPFAGLGLGDHDYDFTISDEFFEHFGYSDISNSNINANVILTRQSNMLVLNFEIRGTVDFTCDRCQDPYTHELKASEQLIVKFSDDEMDSVDEIIVLPPAESKIDISKHLFEYITLTVPYKRVHPDDERGNSLCNKNMIEKLNSLNRKEQADPRWEALKNINL
jgi:uncharacterized metal-binding protein YceD (DUF177 family)